MGLIRPTSGQILLNGEPLISAEQRTAIGYLPEQPYFYDHLTVRETLEFFASLHSIEHRSRAARVQEILDLVGLSGRAKSPIRALSKGLQQRLGLAQAIINKPALLLLDEPFSGLDPVGRIEIRNIVQQLRAAGTTIFMSSHILPDVENICDRAVIMASGVVKAEIVLHDAAAQSERFELAVWDLDCSVPAHAEAAQRAQSSTEQQLPAGKLTTLTFHDREEAQHALAKVAVQGLKIYRFETCSKSLEELFIQVTNDAIRAEGAEFHGATSQSSPV